jgi:hypothetical protein
VLRHFIFDLYTILMGLLIHARVGYVNALHKIWNESNFSHFFLKITFREKYLVVFGIVGKKHRAVCSSF